MSICTSYTHQFSRRNWLRLSSLAVAALYTPANTFAGNKNPDYQYFKAHVNPIPFKLPKEVSIPFNWPVAELPSDGRTMLLTWDNSYKYVGKTLCFRLTCATDIRELCTIELLLAGTLEKIGELDVRFAHYMQPFQLLLSPYIHEKVFVQGIELKMIKGTKPFWFFIHDDKNQEVPNAYLPHLLVSNNVLDSSAWKSRLLSLSSLSTFGWMEGCVLDGIIMMAEQDRKAQKVLIQHLNKYFSNNTLTYESYNNKREVDTINTVESILPFAMLVAYSCNHPMLQKAINFCKDHSDSAGIIADDKGSNRHLKTEECYTIAYPLAVLGKKLKRPDLQAMARDDNRNQLRRLN